MALEPPDRERCQAEHTNDDTFMTLGGQPGKMVRCSNKPTVIAKEKEPGEDGECGSMSLCAECLTEFTKRVPQGGFEFEDIR